MNRSIRAAAIAAMAVASAFLPSSGTANAANADCPINWVCGWNTTNQSGPPAWGFDTAQFQPQGPLIAVSLVDLFGDGTHTFHTTSTYNRTLATYCTYAGGGVDPGAKTNVLAPHTGGNLANTVTNFLGLC
jgi:hypothetical protein